MLPLNLLNIPLIEEMHALYLEDPSKIDPSWIPFFKHLDQETEGAFEFKIDEAAPSNLRIYHLIQAYRTFGHLMANVNPITTHSIEEPYQLKLENLGFHKEELSKLFPTCRLLPEETAPLSTIIDTLKQIYCDKIGIEYMNIFNPELERWLQERMESNLFKSDLSVDQKKTILQDLNQSELFEIFLHTKFTGQKRFSIEGGETLIPMLSSIIKYGSELGLETFIIGMAHRGRLNVLSNILEKSYVDIFSEFEEGYIPQSFEGSGDVKYHKGFSSTLTLNSGKNVDVLLTPNPSHLEAVNPVVLGQVFAKQMICNDGKHSVIPILIHGDAAISGQGIVYESMQMNELNGYSTGGTLHLVVNNQIGFTTVPGDSRSTRYCTDIARTFNVPVFHVNAENPESCVYVVNLAVQIRQIFGCDVFIDLNCYRKYGHNETDEPAFTQPLEYQLIRKKKPIRDIYRDLLIHQGIVEKQIAEDLEEEFKQNLLRALEQIKISEAKKKESEPLKTDLFKPCETGVSKDVLIEIAERLSTIPKDFNIHKKLNRLIQDRLAMIKEDKSIDWGMAETLAYGTLLWEGKQVRLTGQDSCRGTFSHRHALWMDQEKEKAYYPLKHLKDGQGRFDAINSPLSEFAPLGFEFGYSSVLLDALVIWEAQFGDFSNGAQVMIDQFITSAEQKWRQKSNLVMLLPHGYEGQGPEHSSARIERFLSLCGNDNLLVANPTLPAQFFHLLRRQVMASMKKPLIIFTPKGLLRHHACTSMTCDLVKGSFQEILDDPNHPHQTKQMLLCSGRIYYDLIEERNDDTAIIRIEQLYPFHKEKLKNIIQLYTHLEKVYWVQEEPSNMGAWDFMRPQLREIFPHHLEPEYIGRNRSASSATGSFALHKRQHHAIIDKLFPKA